MGGARLCPARSPAQNGRIGLFRHYLPCRVRWFGSRCAHFAGLCGGVVAQHIRRIHRDGAGSFGHGFAPPGECRVPRTTGKIFAVDHSWRMHYRGGGDRARCGIRRRRHPHSRPNRRRRLGIERRQDVHHQWREGRSVLCGGENRSGCEGFPRHLHVHRRKRRAGFSRWPRVEQDRLAEFRHRGTGLRRLPRARGKSAGRRECRILCGHEEFPARAHRRGGDGGRQCAYIAAAHHRICQKPQGFRQRAVRQAGDTPAPGNA